MKQPRDEQGFTLLELLVVIMIIGILAALAIPVFLRQRIHAWDATAKSDVRNLAEFEEIYLSDVTSYGTIAQIQGLQPQLHASPGVTLSVVSYDTLKGYCLSARHSGSSSTWYYDSQAGGLQPLGAAACPVTAGVPGDSLVG